MWIADVGSSFAEEVNFIEAGTGALLNNFGWPRFEGDPPPPNGVEHTNAAQAAEPPVAPVHSYSTAFPNPRGSIIGGFVYRGPDPTLQGDYIFYESNEREFWSYDPATDVATDISAEFFALDENGMVIRVNGKPFMAGFEVGLIVAFAQDNDGNLYVVSHSDGHIFKLTTNDPDPDILTGPGKRGDLNSDGIVDDRDVDLLVDAVGPGANPPLPVYDLNTTPDGMVTFDVSPSEIIASDSDRLIRQLVEIFDDEGIKVQDGSEYGDTNLDGQVFIDDLGRVALKYRDPGQFGWADGNVDGNHNAGTEDDPQVWLTDLAVVARFYRFGRESGASAGAIPEPSGWLLSMWAVFVALSARSWGVRRGRRLLRPPTSII
jgi:hypothetical protein